MEEYKITFYTLMTIYHRQQKDALELAKDYHAIYSTPNKSASPTTNASITADGDTMEEEQKSESKEKEEKHKPRTEESIMEAFKATIVFLALSPYSSEQQDMMNRVNLDPNLEKVPTFKAVLDRFLKKEIIAYPMPQQEEELEKIAEFLQDDLASHWHDMFHRRIIQHNVRIVAQYYKQIRLDRLAQLLQLESDRVEQEVASMVSDGAVYAKIDRPQRIVRFLAPKSAETILSEWAADIDKLLHLVETTSHLINKENMTAQ